MDAEDYRTVAKLLYPDMLPELAQIIFSYLRPIDHLRLRTICKPLQDIIIKLICRKQIPGAVTLTEIFQVHNLYSIYQYTCSAKCEHVIARIQGYFESSYWSDPDFLRCYLYKVRKYVSYYPEVDVSSQVSSPGDIYYQISIGTILYTNKVMPVLEAHPEITAYIHAVFGRIDQYKRYIRLTNKPINRTDRLNQMYPEFFNP